MKDIRCVIIEGPDNSGKDTACDQLQALILNKLGKYPMYIAPKFSSAVNDWPGTMKKLKKTVEDFIANMPDDCVLVMNRSWFDEDVYGPLYRHYRPAETAWVYEIEPRIKNKIAYVTLDDTPERLAAREDGLSFSNGQTEAIIKERERFVKIFQRVCEIGMPHVYVNVAKVSVEDMGKNIFDKLF